MFINISFLLASSALSVGALAIDRTKRSSFPPTLNGVYLRQATNKTWTKADFYQGQSFLDQSQWKFETYPGGDPTHGFVNYLGHDDAISKNLTGVDNNVLTLAVDDFTQLGSGQKRDSVRISTKKTYNGGLFIADFAAMPASCGAWPAWWSVGPNWPGGGEIDVLEGVHVTGMNKMTLHTNEGCSIDAGAEQTGQMDSADCNSSNGDNSGCGVSDSDPTSYGKGFNDAEGGVFAHEWIPESGVRIWHFQRSEIPEDITNQAPNPDNWGTPAGSFPAGPKCDFAQHFTDHVLTIDTTICGDWAGTDGSLVASGCPKKCADIVADPTNFAAAKWKVNYIAVYN
ncbi:concanavalin A-like lectin/glucanase domain-containing protein [Mycena vitilis]|nr:concanavalin A-like lectin/glucanase domain-containing protein [Mycena vitilis]